MIVGDRKFTAGDLNRRIVIKLFTEAADVGYSTTGTDTTIATVWAKVEPVGSAIYQGSKQIDATVTHRFIVRRQASTLESHTVTNRHVVIYNGYRFRVKRVTEYADEREFIVIEAEELGSV